MLYKLLKYTDKDKYESKVISLRDIGPIGEQIIRDCDIEVVSLGMKPGFPDIKKLFELINILKNDNPDIIQSWMYHSNLIAFIASKIAGIKHLVWGIHHSDLKKENNKTSTLLIAKICKLFSHFTSKIVCCSIASYHAHKNIGYSKDKLVIIPNGFEMLKYKADKRIGEKFLENLDIDNKHDFIIGTVGRWDVLKDYPNLIDAINIVVNKKNIRGFKVLMCGHSLDENNKELVQLISEKGLEKYFKLLGRRNDISDLMTALDLFVLSSKGEGFPNVLGEAMASQTPCITTDVGDSASIVGETGLVVPPSDSVALADAISEYLSFSIEERDQRGLAARKRIEETYKIETIVNKYEELYNNLAN